MQAGLGYEVPGGGEMKEDHRLGEELRMLQIMQLVLVERPGTISKLRTTGLTVY